MADDIAPSPCFVRMMIGGRAAIRPSACMFCLLLTTGVVSSWRTSFTGTFTFAA